MVFEWKIQLEKGELLVREIIDIDSTYMDIEDGSTPSKKTQNTEKNQKDDSDNKKDSEEKKEGEEKSEEEDEFNVSLAAMEIEIKPKVMATLN